MSIQEEHDYKKEIEAHHLTKPSESNGLIIKKKNRLDPLIQLYYSTSHPFLHFIRLYMVSFLNIISNWKLR